MNSVNLALIKQKKDGQNRNYQDLQRILIIYMDRFPLQSQVIHILLQIVKIVLVKVICTGQSL